MSAHKVAAALMQLQEELEAVERIVMETIQGRGESMSDQSRKSLQVNQLNRRLRDNPIAVIGMAAVFPESENLQEFWEKIHQEANCIRDVPASRWNVDDYYDPDPKAPDKTYCKRGGFIPDIDFNPVEFGLPPNLLEATDVSQLLSLYVAKRAMEHAGYHQGRSFNRDKVGVILGAAGTQLGGPLGARLHYPIWQRVLKNCGLDEADTQKIIEKIKAAYLQWTEDAFPGMLSNVIAGRIANRLDFGGINFTIDAACASSLAAVKMAVNELVTGGCDMVLTGGVDLDNSVFTYLCFSETPALSRSQQTRPFDSESDGMMLGEGIGMVLLKRLSDAERDGDQIYALIQGVGTSSDGKYKSIYAPRPAGQVRALQDAYADTQVDPATVGLIEAHGTGTRAGDPAEVEALKLFFGQLPVEQQSIALGSVKSQIGHTKAAAGAASLIKTVLALHHKVLPATINVTKPNPHLGLEQSPFYINSETRPWIRPVGAAPRRAGVSSFGFGGTNYHVVLEEYQEDHQQPYRLHQAARVVLLHAPTPADLIERCEAVLHQLKSNQGERSYAELVAECRSLEIPATAARLGFAATSLQDACSKLQTAIGLLIKQVGSTWDHPLGIFYQQSSTDLAGKVVALFPGQGSQYLKMGRELTIDFPELRQTYGYLDNLLAKDRMHRISNVVFPKPAFEPEQQEAQERLLRRTEYAQPAIAAISAGMYKVLRRAGFRPDFVAGHSFGELTALWASEAISEEDYFFLVKARARAMAAPDQPGFDAGTMLAVTGDAQQVEALLQNYPQVTIANWNSNQQVVLAGSKPEIAKVQAVLEFKGFSTKPLSVSGAFHTSLVAHAQQPFAKAIESVTFKSPSVVTYTNVTAAPYSSEPEAIKRNLQNHMCSPVYFKQEIENIYNAGGRFFVEIGPRSILTNLVKEMLGDRPHVAISLNGSRQKDSSYQFQEAVAKLRVAGLALQDLDLYQLPKPLPEARNPKGFYVQLSGRNYISDKTKATFEKALNDGFRIQLAGSVNGNSNGNGNGNGKNGGEKNGISFHPASYPMQTVQIAAHRQDIYRQAAHRQNAAAVTVAKSEVATEAEPSTNSPITLAAASVAVASRSKSENGYTFVASNETKNGYTSNHINETTNNNGGVIFNSAVNRELPTAATVSAVTKPESAPAKSAAVNGGGSPSLPEHIKPMSDSSMNYQHALESLEQNLAQFNQHQAEALKVHSQYLNNQLEYAKLFFQLVQQNQVSSGQSGEAQAALASNLERNILKLHDHQAETLRIHEQSLMHHAEYSKQFFTLMQQQYGLLVGNEVVVQSTVAPVQPVQPIAAPPAEPVPQPPTPQLPVVQPPVGKAEPVLSSVSAADLGAGSTRNGHATEVLVVPAPSASAPAPVVTEPPAEPVAPAHVTIHAEITTSHTEITTSAETVEAVVTTSSTDVDPKLSEMLVQIVSDKTGYPTEMLELDMDMEADLGIDSIKRVEILGSLQELLPEMPKPSPEDVVEIRTLGQVVEVIQKLLATPVLEKKTA